MEMARAEIATRGLSNVRVVHADALNTGLEKNAYDLVHERLVLVTIPAARHSWRRCSLCSAPAERSLWWMWTTYPGCVSRRILRGMSC